MAGKSIEITGLSKLRRVTEQGGEKAKQAIAQGLYLEAQMAFNESQTLVPIDTGILRSSGHITSPVVTPDSVEITIAYGGPATDYAYIVHERIYAPSGKKVYHKPPTRAKYLETPVKRRSKGMGKRLTAFVDRALGKI
jgi:hypothetical protein